MGTGNTIAMAAPESWTTEANSISSTTTPTVQMPSKKIEIPAAKRKVRDARSVERRPRLDWLMNNQIQIALTLIACLLSLHILHRPSQVYTRKFLELSYRTPDGSYKQGVDDIYFVGAWIINFTALRAIFVDWLLTPIAQSMRVPRKAHLRFAEQGWLVVYYGVFWTLGMYLWYNSPYWLNTNELWTLWPAREMSGLFKWYYLVQFSFWLQQIVVVNIEERRRDYAQMFTHHIITCSLVFITYVYRYTRAANVILCLMDAVDLLLPTAKILKYLKFERTCNAVFGLFVATWFFTRHIAYLIVTNSIYHDVPSPVTMEYGCYSGSTNEKLDMDAWPDLGSHLFWPFKDLNGTICLNPEVKWIFMTMVLLLQLLSIIWFSMIIRVIVGMIKGDSAKDNRSDGEDDSEEEEHHAVHKNVTTLGSTTGPLDVNVCTGSTAALALSTSTRRRKSKGNESIRTLLNAEDPKELLRRIGCEKPQ